MTKKLVGKTRTAVIVLELELHDHLSLCGEEYDLPSMTDEEGEDQARVSLEDGELWKMAVASGNTTSGLNDWIECAINSDGWQEILGDISETKDGKYVGLTSCGQIDISVKPKDFEALFIKQSDLEFVYECWENYHCKPLSEIPEKTLERLKRIFATETNIDDFSESDKGIPFEEKEKVEFT